MVIILMFGQSADKKPKSNMMIGHGFSSTTARVLVDNDSLINLNLPKIQSSPL